jgi:hypothetical protein
LGLFLIAEPTGRVWLRRPGPYLALAIGCAVFAPVIAWNLAHGWSSFRFQGGRAFSGFAGPRVDRLALAVAGQAAYTFPWVWGVLVAALASGFNRWCRGTSSIRERFFLWQSIVPLSAFLVVGSWQMLLPHWSLVGLIAVVPLAAERLVQLFAQNRRRAIVRVSTWGALPTLVGVIVLAHTHCGVLQREGRVLVHWLAPSRDPSLDLYGWGQVAQRMRERGLLEGAGNYLFTSKWYHSSQLAFALGQGDRVLCYSNRAPLGYADWTRPEQWVGRDGVLAVVNHSSTEPSAFDRWFERIEPLDTLTVYRAGAPVKVVTLYRCVNQLRPFPYIDGMHGDVAQPTEWPRQERASLTEPVRR